MKPVVIFGIGDFGRVAFEYFTREGGLEVAAFTVHRQFLDAPQLFDRPVVAFESLPETHPPGRYAVFVAVGYSGMNKLRAKIFEECKQLGYALPSFVSSRAHHLGSLDVGQNCFILENNVIQPFVKIGDDVVLWSGNHIGHDSQIGDHCFITSHAVIAGRVTVGAYCFVGINATIRDGVTVAPECLIGAGALVLRNTTPGAVYAEKSTTPARVRSWQMGSVL